jgi:hypothetical protein
MMPNQRCMTVPFFTSVTVTGVTVVRVVMTAVPSCPVSTRTDICCPLTVSESHGDRQLLAPSAA